MKKIFFLASALAVLAACSNNDELPLPTPEKEAMSIDLRSMNYEEVMTLLSEQSSLKNVTFVDGATTRNVSELVPSDNVDANQAEVLIFNSANETDSVELMVTPECVAVRMTTDGKLMAYMSFADENQQNEIVGLYEETIPATRSGEPVVTRGVDGESFSLDLTEVAEVMTARAETEGSYVLPEKELKYQTSVATRTSGCNLFKSVVGVFAPTLTRASKSSAKAATIDIYLMREKGANPLTHEMNWQANDAIKSLKNVYSDVNFNVYIKDCDYKGTNNSSETLGGFGKWLSTSQYRKTDGVFFLCRWGGWKGVLGMAWMCDYNVNNDRQSSGISATNAWNKYVLAHEIGHNFGALHVKNNWWQICNTDLMTSNSYDWMSSGKHKDATNRAEIQKRLTLK